MTSGSKRDARVSWPRSRREENQIPSQAVQPWRPRRGGDRLGRAFRSLPGWIPRGRSGPRRQPGFRDHGNYREVSPAFGDVLSCMGDLSRVSSRLNNRRFRESRTPQAGGALENTQDFPRNNRKQKQTSPSETIPSRRKAQSLQERRGSPRGCLPERQPRSPEGDGIRDAQALYLCPAPAPMAPRLGYSEWRKQRGRLRTRGPGDGLWNVGPRRKGDKSRWSCPTFPQGRHFLHGAAVTRLGSHGSESSLLRASHGH